MKIQSNDPVSRLKEMLNRLEEPERASQGRSSSTDAGNKTGGTSATQDEVQLSARAREIQKLHDEVAASPDLRESIVSKLRTEIASGQYRIDGTRIADGLLKEDLPG